MPTNLSVNINKFATLRNSRGGNMPDVLKMAMLCEQFGAQGITVHPRPDERHIRYADVVALKPLVATEFNIEGYPSERFLQLIEQVRPTQVTLVPDAPGDLTSHEGWDVERHRDLLSDVVAHVKRCGARASIFVNPDRREVEAAAKVGADRIELYTEPYARRFERQENNLTDDYAEAAAQAIECNLGINAGHDLNQQNLLCFKNSLPGLDEVSIGHALVCEALLQGLETTIGNYRRILA